MSLTVGVDIGKKSPHEAIILRRENGVKVNPSFRFRSTPQGIDHLLKRVKKAREGEEDVSFALYSPGRAWVPIAAALKAKGYRVYRPTASKVKSLRKATNRKNKTDRIDATSLARTLIVDPEGTEELFLATGKKAKLDQLVRQREKIVDSIRKRKLRIQAHFEAINPYLMQALGQLKFTEAGRAFMRSHADPRKVVRMGKVRLGKFLRGYYRLTIEDRVIENIFRICQDAVKFYKSIRDACMMPFDEEDVQKSICWELDMLEIEEKAVSKLDKKIKSVDTELDPQRVLPSLAGIGDILAAGIRSVIGDIDRFDSITKHRGYAGLCPRVRKSGNRESSHLSISKMSSSRYKRYLYLAADNARKWDVEMAAFYHKCRQGGHTHIQAVCAVANGKLVPRIHCLLKRNRWAENNNQHRHFYVFKDLSDNPISKREAKAIIEAKWGNVTYS